MPELLFLVRLYKVLLGFAIPTHTFSSNSIFFTKSEKLRRSQCKGLYSLESHWWCLWSCFINANTKSGQCEVIQRISHEIKHSVIHLGQEWVNSQVTPQYDYPALGKALSVSHYYTDWLTVSSIAIWIWIREDWNDEMVWGKERENMTFKPSVEATVLEFRPITPPTKPSASLQHYI